jgi:hypothetical protein
MILRAQHKAPSFRLELQTVGLISDLLQLPWGEAVHSQERFEIEFDAVVVQKAYWKFPMRHLHLRGCQMVGGAMEGDRSVEQPDGCRLRRIAGWLLSHSFLSFAAFTDPVCRYPKARELRADLEGNRSSGPVIYCRT